MNKKKNPISDIIHSEFVWLRDPAFTPPGKGGGAETCLTHEFSAPRIGELRTLLKLFLENIITTVGAAAGVVRLLSSDGHTLQLISSSGLSAELEEDEEGFEELNCEFRHNASLGGTVDASDISLCNVRENCRYTGCHFQSLIGVPLEPPHSHGKPLGILTLFFDKPHETAVQAMNMVMTFAEIMSATIEHTHINREPMGV